MHRTAILQVAHAGNLQVLKRTLRLADTIEVKHTLCRVLVGTVAGIDYRHSTHLAGIAAAALLRVTHNNQVGIAGHHNNRIVQRLALLHTRATRIAETDNPGAQLVGGTLKAESRTCRRLEEERSHHLVAQNRLFRILLEFLCNVEHLYILVTAEVCNGNQIPSF